MKRVVVVCLVLLGCSRASPTTSLSANPASVAQGQCATLTWSSTNASTVSIDQGVGTVDASGSKEVCPEATTQYTITAAADGKSGTAATTVEVAALAAATPKIMVFPEAALFEFGKSELKPEGKAKIGEYREEAKDELGRADQVAVTGYTDNVGGADHNSTLSLKRAEAVRDHLVSLGADPNKFHVTGAGESNPMADNGTEDGRAKNRRVEVAVFGVGK
jgi:outer membrane protein OmpA-like peptidoglycan-associated protein